MIIVTGASGGLGRRLVLELRECDRVVGTYFRNNPQIAAESIRLFRVDVTDCESIDRFVEAIRDGLTRITLVNLAGLSINRLAVELAPEEWDQVLAVNLKGSFLMSKALLRFMMRERWGRIINISSIVAQTGVSGTSAYAASKAGVMGLTRTLAKEYARYDITVNCLALGYFSNGLIETVPEAARKAILERIPLQRFGDVIEISRAIKYLIDASYVTGTVIEINGGLT